MNGLQPGRSGRLASPLASHSRDITDEHWSLGIPAHVEAPQGRSWTPVAGEQANLNGCVILLRGL